MSLEDIFYRRLGIYKASPLFLKRMLGALYNHIPLNIRYGGKYQFFQDLVTEADRWTIAEIERYQLEQLNMILGEAQRNVPYYQNSLKNVRLPFASFKDFRENVPFTNKEEVRRNPESFINRSIYPNKLISISTGGTTGEPLKIVLERGVNRVKEIVHLDELWRRIGYHPNDSRVVFRGTLIKNKKKNKLWEYDPIKNRYFFSSFDLTVKNIRRYISQLNRIQPLFLHVYPSVLTIIASFMLESGLRLNFQLKGILCGSENTFPSQYEIFDEVFHAPIMRWYGLGEEAALAGSCEYSKDYHAFNAYSFPELIGDDGQSIVEVGGVGEIVGTPFYHSAMPLIRYRTSDYAVYGGMTCGACGRNGMLLKEIIGREQETIFDQQGNRFSLGPFIFGVHEAFWADINQIQFEQSEKGKLVVRAVSYKLSEIELVSYLKRLFEPRFSPNFTLSYTKVDSIPASPRGKHQYLIQNLKR